MPTQEPALEGRAHRSCKGCSTRGAALWTPASEGCFAGEEAPQAEPPPPVFEYPPRGTALLGAPQLPRDSGRLTRTVAESGGVGAVLCRAGGTPPHSNHFSWQFGRE